MTLIGLITWGGVVVMNRGGIVEVINTQPETVVEVKEVIMLDERIKNAQNAEMSQIKASAQEAYDAYIQKELKRIEDKVKIEYIQELEATITDESYWREGKRIKRLIRQTFPENPEVAVAVATCESGLNPKAYNPNNRDGSTDGGLFQINSTHDKKLNELGLDKWNVHDNIKFARILYDESGFKPWVCYTHNMIVMR